MLCLLWLPLLGAPCQAQTWHEVSDRICQQGSALATQISDQTWGGQMSSQDLQLLLGALQVVDQWGQGEDSPLHREVLHDTRLTISRYRQRLRMSLATLPAPQGQTAQDWLTQVEELEQHLGQVENAFGGYHLPTQQQLALSPWDRNWTLPGYDDPQELARESRSLRLNVQSLFRPSIYPGNGLGNLGLGYGGGWATGAELQDLYQAVANYESVCNSRYEDVVQTRRSYQRLQNAFDRLWPGIRNQSFNLRDVERTLDRLSRFYRAMEPPRP